VQGVGFRFAAERIALSLDIKGWVRNNPEGTVEVLAEGEEKDLVIFMDKIKKAMGNYIENTRVNWEDYAGKLDSFGIKFY
jgi:acylphosphatase